VPQHAGVVVGYLGPPVPNCLVSGIVAVTNIQKLFSVALSSKLKSARVRKSVDVCGKEMRVVGVVMAGSRSVAPLLARISSPKPLLSSHNHNQAWLSRHLHADNLPDFTTCLEQVTAQRRRRSSTAICLSKLYPAQSQEDSINARAHPRTIRCV
jgi:hypothetical protein